mmetsp:Transcript_12522/g.28638  ORF Transcript_12522/g.28638 Transcript_12522/m.28638 type:complete len:208 (+) Transcript_12522:1298-1921(+)
MKPSHSINWCFAFLTLDFLPEMTTAKASISITAPAVALILSKCDESLSDAFFTRSVCEPSKSMIARYVPVRCSLILALASRTSPLMPLILIEFSLSVMEALVNRDVRRIKSELDSSLNFSSDRPSMLSITRVVAMSVSIFDRHFFTFSSGPRILTTWPSRAMWMRTPSNSVSSLAMLLPPFPMTPPKASPGTLNFTTMLPSPPFKKV